MNKEFINYAEALALKELGFDEPCLMYWNDFGKTSINRFQLLNKIDEWCQDYIEAPLYQQAFDYILKFHLKKYSVETFSDDRVRIYDENNNSTDFINKDSCLKKLIEIAKKQK